MSNEDIETLRRRVAEDVARGNLDPGEAVLLMSMIEIAERFRAELGEEKLAKILIAILVTSCNGCVQVATEVVPGAGGPIPEAH